MVRETLIEIIGKDYILKGTDVDTAIKIARENYMDNCSSRKLDLIKFLEIHEGLDISLETITQYVHRYFETPNEEGIVKTLSLDNIFEIGSSVFNFIIDAVDKKIDKDRFGSKEFSDKLLDFIKDNISVLKNGPNVYSDTDLSGEILDNYTVLHLYEDEEGSLLDVKITLDKELMCWFLVNIDKAKRYRNSLFKLLLRSFNIAYYIGTEDIEE